MVAVLNTCVSIALAWFLQSGIEWVSSHFFCDSEKSAEKLEALEAQKEESANFLQAQDMENIIH